MKKENIYKLIEMGYKGGNDFNLYISEFINKLNDEKYFEMAEYIQELQFKNSKVLFSSETSTVNLTKTKNNHFIFPSSIKKKTDLIIKGYKKSLIKKVLLVGKPGTGKTSYVEYIAKTMDLPLINVKISDILDYKYGESVKKMELLMNEYMKTKCIIFFDEADSLFRKRGMVNDIYETDRIVSTMLKELDKDTEPLIFFASNLYNDLDKAIIRRIDEIINFDIYEYKTLIRIWDDYAKFYKISEKINKNILDQFILKKIEFITPSDLKNISKKIAILLLDNNNNNISSMVDEFLEEYFNYRIEVK